MNIITCRKDDWCHWCGSRDNLLFAEFGVPENAEHDKTPSRYHRVCEKCVENLSLAIFTHIRDEMFPQLKARDPKHRTPLKPNKTTFKDYRKSLNSNLTPKGGDL